MSDAHIIAIHPDSKVKNLHFPTNQRVEAFIRRTCSRRITGRPTAQPGIDFWISATPENNRPHNQLATKIAEEIYTTCYNQQFLRTDLNSTIYITGYTPTAGICGLTDDQTNLVATAITTHHGQTASNSPAGTSYTEIVVTEEVVYRIPTNVINFPTSKKPVATTASKTPQNTPTSTTPTPGNATSSKSPTANYASTTSPTNPQTTTYTTACDDKPNTTNTPKKGLTVTCAPTSSPPSSPHSPSPVLYQHKHNNKTPTTI